MDNNDFLTDWGLSLMVFLPLAGALRDDAHPQGRGAAAQGRGARRVAGLGRASASRCSPTSTTTTPASCSSSSTSRGSRSSSSATSSGIDGLSLPLRRARRCWSRRWCIIYSWNHFPEPHNPKAFLILILVLAHGMLGTFVAQDLILFFVFFEVVLLPMYFMIGVWGGEQRQYAAIKFFLYTLFGSALMIVSFLALFFVAGGETFSMAELAEGVAERNAAGTSR